MEDYTKNENEWKKFQEQIKKLNVQRDTVGVIVFGISINIKYLKNKKKNKNKKRVKNKE